MLDPHPTFESAMEWIRKNLFRDNVYIDGNIRQNMEALKEHIGRPIPYTKVYGLKTKYPWANESQMLEIVFGLKDGVDVSLYAKPEYDYMQMGVIRFGLLNGIDITHYAFPEYSWEQMQQIQFGVEDGIDFLIYTKKEFDADQMREIRFGLLSGIDVSEYADPQIEAKEMKETRERLEWLYGKEA